MINLFRKKIRSRAGAVSFVDAGAGITAITLGTVFVAQMLGQAIQGNYKDNLPQRAKSSNGDWERKIDIEYFDSAVDRTAFSSNAAVATYVPSDSNSMVLGTPAFYADAFSWAPILPASDFATKEYWTNTIKHTTTEVCTELTPGGCSDS